MMNVVCLCVLSLVLVAIANLTTVELKSCLTCLHEKSVDHLSGPSFVTSPHLVSSLQATCDSSYTSSLTSFAQSPGQYCSRQLCGDTVFVFAVFVLAVSFFWFLPFLFLLLEERLHRITFPLLLLTFVMASSQMHCR